MTGLIVRAGITDPIVFQCQEVDTTTRVVTPVVLTGATAAELHLRDTPTKTALSPFTLASGKLAIPTPANGRVTFYPDSDDLDPGVYECYMVVTDVSGKTLAFPSDGSFELTVLDEY